MRRALIKLLPVFLILGLASCSDDETKPTDTGSDVTPDISSDAESDVEPDVAPDVEADAADVEEDAEPPFEYEGEYAEATQVEVDTTLVVEGLNYPVHIRIDEFGIPHILASSWEDVFFAQGYLNARDRFPQMEIFRHATSGRLSRLLGVQDESLIDDDIFVRMMGFNRVAREIYDSLEEGSLEKLATDAYAAGINVHIDHLRDGTAEVPPPLRLSVNPATLLDWEPWDGYSIIRLNQFDLSFDADDEVGRTRDRIAVAAAFPSDSEDADLAARARILDDIQRFQNPDRTYQIPGFGSDEKSAAPSGPLAGLRPEMSVEELDRVSRLIEEFPRSELFPRPFYGGSSNSWAVNGERSATGNALLANDPHLGLDSPTVFYQSHLVVEPQTEDDGPALNVFGIMFPGLPGILIGHNEDVAWGLTTASYDYTDAFAETFVDVEGEDYPRVRHNDEDVELEVIEEVIEIGLQGNVVERRTVELLWVPHRRGPIAMDIRDGQAHVPPDDEAVSFAWRGFWDTNEVASIVAWMLAESIDDIEDEGLDDWVIGTQNLLFADSSGDIFTTGSSFIAQRPAAALTWDPDSNVGGTAPWWVLSGTGEHDWLEEGVPLEDVPYVRNPDVEFIVTANNDQIGVTDDNNPLSHDPYLGYDYAVGFRAGRITRLLNGDAGVYDADHAFTLEDLGAIQADVYSDFGERSTPFLLTAALNAIDEFENPGNHPDLAGIVANQDGADRVEALHDLLDAWSFTAEDGVVGSPTGDQLTDARATSLFNVWATQVGRLAFNDELGAVPGLGLGSSGRARSLLWVLENPTETATFDADSGQSILWDDLATSEAKESRDYIIATALLQADLELERLFESSASDDWLWGELHTRSFDALVPDTSLADGSTSLYEWPQPDETYPDGFPQPGDNWNVDRCDGGLTDSNFRCGGGSVVRFLVELDPEDGVRALNQIPGGQVQDHESPHFRDLLDDAWLPRDWFPVPFHPEQVRDVDGEHLLLDI